MWNQALSIIYKPCLWLVLSFCWLSGEGVICVCVGRWKRPSPMDSMSSSCAKPSPLEIWGPWEIFLDLPVTLKWGGNTKPIRTSMFSLIYFVSCSLWKRSWTLTHGQDVKYTLSRRNTRVTFQCGWVSNTVQPQLHTHWLWEPGQVICSFRDVSSNNPHPAYLRVVWRINWAQYS